MLAAGGEHQQGFGFQMHIFVQQQLTQLFPERCSARVARCHDAQPAGAQQLDYAVDVAAFSGAVDAFEGDESAACAALGHRLPLL